MSVAIKEIHVRNLGPHRQFSTELGQFNLIFGHNEEGKTFLVEFIIRSLFRQSNQWTLRDQKGTGKVILQGLSNGQLVEFSPDSPKKLEDYWEEAKTGLPADFSKLLVVKGAEVEIVDVEGGVDKNIMKRLLSGKNVLDKIQNRISKILQKSKLENNSPIGPKTGEIKERLELISVLENYDDLFSQIDSDFSGGQRNLMIENKQLLQDQIQEIKKAKQFQAYSLNQDVKRLRDKINRMPLEKINEIQNELSSYRQKKSESMHKEQTQVSSEERSEHYEWLKNAYTLYQNELNNIPEQPKPYFLFLSIIFVIIAGVLVFLKLPIFALISLLFICFFGLLYFKKYKDFADKAPENQEIEKLKKSFQDKFNQELADMPLMLELLDKMEDDYNEVRFLKKQLQEDLSQIQILESSISRKVYTLLGERKAPGTWDEVLRISEDSIKQFENQVNDKMLELAKLDVDPSDYQTEPSSVIYSKEKLDELKKELGEIESKIEKESQKLTNLKQLICRQTGDSFITEWEEVIGHLREKREGTLRQYKEKTAEIIGKLAVHEVIKELKKDEDSKLLSALKSKEVQEPLFQLTKRYKNINLEEEKLVVSDEFHDFRISELSTGAQEQILLALRIGFATKIAARDSLFLILDDAFQYSDWQRRKLLMEKIVQLAKEGWQIIYFTMDDHIRRLFDEKGKQFGTEYNYVELPTH
ncbi:hypothetical protein IIA28_04080 [candidate division KSB1 bacterium]|nr:hypothetical protein [candidate division KSB1 bacterium]